MAKNKRGRRQVGSSDECSTVSRISYSSLLIAIVQSSDRDRYGKVVMTILLESGWMTLRLMECSAENMLCLSVRSTNY